MNMKRLFLGLLVAVALFIGINLIFNSDRSVGAPNVVTPLSWQLYAGNPVISQIREPAGLDPAVMTNGRPHLWNDPSVMREGDHYTMWASLGFAGGTEVYIYRLTSPDGKNWTVSNSGKPVLSPDKNSDDFNGVETPAVIKVADTYHMYYSFYPDKPNELTSMAHATSKDGINWTKLGPLTSLTDKIGEQNFNNWGWLARAEPAPVYYDGTFYLFFTDVKCRASDCKSGSPNALRGISLATSKDGHNFKQVGNEPVLLQTDAYSAREGWEGYTTPWAYHDGENFQLYVGVLKYVNQNSITQAIAHYQSVDGKVFTEVETDIVTPASQPWAKIATRAPTVIEENGVVKMWYAGDSADPSNLDFQGILSGHLPFGIGYGEGVF